MNILDVIIFLISFVGLIYFALERFKYSNKNVYFQKLEKLHKLQTQINKIISDNEEMELLIRSINKDFDFNNIPADKLIEYRDTEEKLKYYKDECKIIESYLNKARPYIKEKL